MAHKAPGKSHRNGISLLEPAEMFPDEESARKWFVRYSDTDLDWVRRTAEQAISAYMRAIGVALTAGCALAIGAA